MSATQIPRPNYLQTDKWAALIGNRQWEDTPDGWVEVTEHKKEDLVLNPAMLAKMEVDRFNATKGQWSTQGGPSLLLTSIGRKSGKEHTLATNYMPYGGSWVVVGSLAGLPVAPQWALNLDQVGRGKVQLKDQKWEVTARKMSEQELERFWPTLTSLFPLWNYFQRHCQRKFKVFVLTPTQLIAN
ncbi:MAG: hypothetical protein CMQ15_14195 [Gammaproteobacteria bacterium]|jgi:deazaflavin-dependent oxidoreductase (nitroreductase family)|nr:hypothetical protein [Gammaproteobacteria bacterium]|tara:strand:- start:3335 stop:3889 length:555 start_codon:yes stop_codon:yes gene_type:complete